jgi:hypothetical protein
MLRATIAFLAPFCLVLLLMGSGPADAYHTRFVTKNSRVTFHDGRERQLWAS